MSSKPIQLIPKDANIGCPWCRTPSKAKDWNDESAAACITREMRRAFMPIFNRAVFKRDSKYFYKCPLCGQWSRGSNLSILKEGESASNIPSAIQDSCEFIDNTGSNTEDTDGNTVDDDVEG